MNWTNEFHEHGDSSFIAIKYRGEQVIKLSNGALDELDLFDSAEELTEFLNKKSAIPASKTFGRR